MNAPLLALVLGAVTLVGCAPAQGTTSTPAPARTPASAAEAAPPSQAAVASGDLLPLRYDAATGKVFLTIPRLDEDMLYLNTLATGMGSQLISLDRGEVGEDAVVRFERHGARVFLVRSNTQHRAVGGDDALQRSVAESFPRSVLASFAVQGASGGGTTVDATDFLLSDVFGVAARIRDARAGSVRLDRERSFIDPERTRSFAGNTEVRSVLSFVTDDPSFLLRRHAPDARSVVLEQQHSFVRLPASPLPIRAFDPRSGFFSTSYFDFAQPFTADYRQRATMRWRLEPSDRAAYLRGEKVEPVRPIVYYLDPAIPEPYRSAFTEGGMWWNRIFEAAGWRNAFRIEPLPAGVHPLDARYPVIYWVHRQGRGPSVGPTFSDPRTGEILSTVVRMDSYRSLVDHDIYMGLVPAAGNNLQLTAEQFSMGRRRQHTAHEIGHTLGLAHNFIAATQGRASVMDYPYPLIRLDERGAVDISQAYRTSGGAHDTLAIRYGYTWYPDSQSEAAGLRRILAEAESKGMRFVADQHASLAGSIPGATQWVEGADMFEALERTMAVRRVLIDRFDERAAQPGEPMAVLNRRFAHVYLHHRYALNGAIKTIGGMEFGYAMRGEPTERTRILPASEQGRALRLILANLQPQSLAIPERVAAMIPPVPPGYDADLTLIQTPAGTAFDPLAAAHSLAQEIVQGLLHPERAARLVSFQARSAENLSLDDVLAALTSATWDTDAQGSRDAALRRVAQRAALDGMLDLAGSTTATADVRAVTEMHLSRLRDRLARGGGGSAEDQAHRLTARRDIELYFDGRDDRARRPRPQPIPLPWP